MTELVTPFIVVCILIATIAALLLIKHILIIPSYISAKPVELVANEYGIEIDHIQLSKLRIHRTNGLWLVEYRRAARWPLGLDRWWWFNDGTYIDYSDAYKRVTYLHDIGYVSKTRFQTVKTFDI